jgi:hypothetical protein
MTRLNRAVVLGIVALAAAFAASAATISSPLRPSASPLAAARLAGPGQEGLDLDASALPALRRSAAGRIEGFPVAPGTLGTLVLDRFEVLAPGARITVSGPDGESSHPFVPIAHFSGSIEGDAGSRVYLAVRQNGLVAYVQSREGSAYVGPDESKTDYVVRSSDSPLTGRDVTETWACGAEEMPAALRSMAEPSFPTALAPLVGLQQAAVRIETDYELYDKHDSVEELGEWVETLYGAINVIYERDLSLHLALSEVHTWSGGAASDPYASSSTRTQLDEVGDWWHANRPIAQYPRAMVHYLSGKPVSGGIAWLSVLCSGDFNSGGHWGGAYGVTQVYGTYPLAFWDQLATSHEMGHNSGSHHTHCYVPAIDHCYNGESGCYSGPQEPPAGGGTIMSYCHLNYGSSLVFHQRCIDEQLLPHINAANCVIDASTFLDVPPSHAFFSYVETIAALEITTGCGPNLYCPDAPVTRAQMAVFLLKAMYGSTHTPPAATGTVFGDVSAGSFAAAWIEELDALGVTGGCGGGNYCPTGTVSREQMSVFLLKAKYGAAHQPPSAAGVFADVPSGDNYEAWIEELYAETITGGCLTNPLRYCPNGPNTRGQMAVFLVKTFDLP